MWFSRSSSEGSRTSTSGKQAAGEQAAARQAAGAGGSEDGGARDQAVAAARQLYFARDFRDVTLADVARAAGLPVPAVREQFDDEAELFAAVYREVLEEAGRRIAERMTADDPIELMRNGVEAYLEVFTHPDIRHLMLLQPMTAFGWDRWHEEGREHGSLLVDATLVEAMERGVIAHQPVRPLAAMITGALEAAVHHAATHPDFTEGLAEAKRVLDDLVTGMLLIGSAAAEDQSQPRTTEAR